jgi:SNF2 family DNA or RNA helicase
VGNWAKEFDRWLGVQGQPKRVKLLKGDTTFNSSSMKGFLHSKVGQVVILSYELFRLHSHHFENGARFGLLVVDEGHRLKSTSGSLTLASLERLPAEARLLLSATPIQNNLGEFYALANFCRPGILGQDLTEFRSRFERPILRHRSCSSGDRRANECPAQRELDGIVSTFLLRRLQRDILKSALPPRTELLLFCRPSRRQVELYQRVVEGARGALGGSSTEVLTALTSLRKVCSHPLLLHGTASTYPSLYGVEDVRDTALQLPDGNADEVVDLSGKLSVLRGLLRSMTESNQGSNAASPDKVVIVSNFTSTLSLVESLVLEPAGHTYLRLDGATSMEDRQARVEAFNKQPGLLCFLLSSKAGGWCVCGMPSDQQDLSRETQSHGTSFFPSC